MHSLYRCENKPAGNLRKYIPSLREIIASR
jgi:hypothetical protein